MASAGGRGAGWIQSAAVPGGPAPMAIFPRTVGPDDFPIEVVAWALAGKPRFSAHCRPWYGVGQHSVLVSKVAAQLAVEDGLPWRELVEVSLWGLLHEGDEVYLPDLAAPIKDWPEFAPLREIAAQHQAAVCLKYSLPLVPPPQVKRADLILLATEKRDVMGPSPLPWPELPEPLQEPLVAWTPAEAEAEFLERFHYLERFR